MLIVEIELNFNPFLVMFFTQGLSFSALKPIYHASKIYFKNIIIHAFLTLIISLPLYTIPDRPIV